MTEDAITVRLAVAALESLAKAGDGYRDTGWISYSDGYAYARIDLAQTAQEALDAIAQAYGAEPAADQGPPDTLLDLRLSETLADFGRVRTTDELIRGLEHQIRKLEDGA